MLGTGRLYGNICAMDDDDSMRIGKELVFRQFGPPRAVLEFEGRALISQSPEPGDVLVRILAAPLNPADLNTIEGTYGFKPALPATPGIEGCGIVEASNSADFEVGDRVIFLRRASTWASHTAVPGSSLFKLPAEIDPLQAAMLKVNPATAWRLLHGFAPLENGSWIVQNVGNSAVGRCVIQLARDLGIRTISFVRRAELFDELRALGADEVFTDDESGYASAKEVLGGANAALAFNAVGGESALRLMKLLRERGCHITYGAMGRKPLTIPNGLLIFRDIQVRGLWVTRWIENARPEEIHGVYANLAARVTAGKLMQPVDSTFPLESYRDALARLEATERSGKVLFVP
jgi:NADPH:quinone reductase-like Zn-dependent oxidoreductase